MQNDFEYVTLMIFSIQYYNFIEKYNITSSLVRWNCLLYSILWSHYFGRREWNGQI